jgi:hypothetical protein
MNAPKRGFLSNAVVDKYLDGVLRASGSALRYYSMHKTIENMREAMRAAIQLGYAAGWQDRDLHSDDNDKQRGNENEQ